MSRLYAMQGLMSKELITYQGRVMVHNDRAEMEFLFIGVRVVECPPDFTPEQLIKVRDHPDFTSYKWPLKRNEFNNGPSPDYFNYAARARLGSR